MRCAFLVYEGVRSELGLGGLIEVGHDEALSGKRGLRAEPGKGLWAGHFPVMLDACVDALVQQPDGCYVDGTVGGGGHTEAILHRLSEEGKLIGFDRDEQAIARVKKRLRGDPRLSLVHSKFV